MQEVLDKIAEAFQMFIDFFKKIFGMLKDEDADATTGE